MTVTSSGGARQRVNNLPADVSSFVGRRHETSEVRRLLARSRLVTLTGVGGVGKTRLALRVGFGLRRVFDDGVWLVDLSTLTDPSLVAQATAEALEIRDQSGRPAGVVLGDYLRDRKLLLILDNCEHLLHECAVLVDELMAVASNLRILATSRQPLNLTSEYTMPVPPLSLPEDGGQIGRAELAQSEAVALFTERARAVAPEFTVNAENRDAVVRICRELDGLPLAIELAAARLRSLSPKQIVDRLSDRYRLLANGPRAVAPRHQSLQALVDWSYGLCSAQEQLLWARASVFASGFDLEAVEWICSGEGIDTEDVIDLVADLIDKSILIKNGPGSTARYRMLETIRQHGNQRLAASGDEERMRRRHRDHYRRLAHRASQRVFGGHQVEWFGRIRLEHANMRLALEYCRDHPGERTEGLRLATDLLYHWITSYYLNEGRTWLDTMLAATMDERTLVRVDALWSNSWLAIIQGDVPAAKSLLAEGRELAEELRSDRATGYVALFSGFVAMYAGEATVAVDLYTEALRHHRTAGNQHGVALTLIRSSLAHSFLGDSDTAVALGEECVTVCDSAEDIWHKSYALMALAIEVWARGDTRRATVWERESLRFNQSLDDRLGVALNIEVLAWIAAKDGDYERAARMLGSLRNLWRSVGAPLSGYGHLVGYHDECEARTQQALGEQTFRALLEEGSRLGYEQAVTYGFQEDPPPAERATPEAESTMLTKREWQIARLVAEGRSNKEIAGTLVIAQRTAEAHVAHILSKLGFNSRAQVAAWVAEHDESP
jgi:predicted ATPase/DNA-binding CsgD family transcriptional regulator